MLARLSFRTGFRKNGPRRERSRPASRLRLERLEDRCVPSADVVQHWNELLLQSFASQPPRVPPWRNLALVHVAVYDAVNSIDRSHTPYFVDVRGPRGASQ